MAESCPFCGEPVVRWTRLGNVFRCGTSGPDTSGEYDVGHTCDIATWGRLLQAKDAEIEGLRAGIAAVRKMADDLENARRGAESLNRVRVAAYRQACETIEQWKEA